MRSRPIRILCGMLAGAAIVVLGTALVALFLSRFENPVHGIIWLLSLTLAPIVIHLGWTLRQHCRLRRIRLRFENGRCPRCGYDVRAAKQRCPECGFTGGFVSDLLRRL